MMLTDPQRIRQAPRCPSRTAVNVPRVASRAPRSEESLDRGSRAVSCYPLAVGVGLGAASPGPAVPAAERWINDAGT